MMKTRFVLMLLPFTLSARPLDIRSPNLEPSRGAKPRPPIMVPVGCDKLLSSGCAVSSSDTQVGSEARRQAVFRATPLFEQKCGGRAVRKNGASPHTRPKHFVVHT